MEQLNFRHEALLYEGDDEFLAATLPFVSRPSTPGSRSWSRCRAPAWSSCAPTCTTAPSDVALVDMEVLGANPARIIPAWEDFVAEHAGAGRRLRGIGEPIWDGRGAAELAECQQHESLLNVAFADGPPFWLVCPYDTGGARRAA